MGQYQTGCQINESCRKEECPNNEQLVKLIEPYYADNARKLSKVVNDIVNRKFSAAQKDIDFFYSVANNVIAEILYQERYDPKCGDFEGYLYKSLVFAFIDEIKKENRQKRRNVKLVANESGNGNDELIKVFIQDISLEAPIDGMNPESLTYGDVIESNVDVETEVCNLLGQNCSDEMGEYLDSLSGLSRKVAKQIMAGSKPHEIREDLGLTEKQYQVVWQELNSYDKKRILYNLVYRDGNNAEVEDMGKNETNVLNKNEKKKKKLTSSQDTMEKYKNISYSIEEISRQMGKGYIRDDHILQRYGEQWNNIAKSELVADILKGKSLTQIIISEEYRKGIRFQWVIDGKQRCTILDSYLHDGFKISRTLEDSVVRYQTEEKDENGNILLDDEGFPKVNWETFDIKGKSYSQLPEDLQCIFKRRQIPILYNMDCTSDEIIADISRFNRGKPMNRIQNGWLHINENFGSLVKDISELDFFQPTFPATSYTKTTEKNSSVLRVIVEGIMVCYFVNDFHPDLGKICDFLNVNASDHNFVDFYKMVEERLTPICKEIADVSKTIFNAKDSFIWFGIFFRFLKLNLGNDNDGLFADFIKAFVESLHTKEIDEVSFDKLNEKKTTKDRSIVVAKVNLLEKLMIQFISERTGKPVETLMITYTCNDVCNGGCDDICDDGCDNDSDNDCNNNCDENLGGDVINCNENQGEDTINCNENLGDVTANNNDTENIVDDVSRNENVSDDATVPKEMVLGETVPDEEVVTRDESDTENDCNGNEIGNDEISDDVAESDTVSEDSVAEEEEERILDREEDAEIAKYYIKKAMGSSESAATPKNRSLLDSLYAIHDETKEHFNLAENDIGENDITDNETTNNISDCNNVSESGEDTDNLTVEDVVAIANQRVLDFIGENVDSENCKTFEDVAFLKEMLKDYIDGTKLGAESQIFNAKNRTPLLAMVQYCLDTESDEYFAEWMAAMEESGIDVPMNDDEAKVSFGRMKAHFDTYVAKKSQAA